jgi:RNA polymerase sigma-70 factor (ECF subfamily)
MTEAAKGMCDKALWARVKAGDEGAFCQVMQRYETGIFSFAYRFLGSKEEAEDVLQDTFLRAYQYREHWDGKRARISTWLYTIAANRCRDELRKRSRRKETSMNVADDDGRNLEDCIPSLGSGPDQEARRGEFYGRLRDAVSRLPESLRCVLILSESEGLNYREISKVLGCSLGTVKSRAFRARKQLYKFLKDLEPDFRTLGEEGSEEVIRSDGMLVLPTIDS